MPYLLLIACVIANIQITCSWSPIYRNSFWLTSTDSIKAPPYAELACTEQDQDLITKLITLFAQRDSFWISTHIEELKKKAKPLKRVHILKIIETVYTTKKLKTKIKEIYNSPIKWDALVSETQKRMHKAEKKGTLHIYVNDFSSAIHVPSGEIDGFFLNRDWEGLLIDLVNRL